MSRRAEYIRRNYSLSQEGGTWIARKFYRGEEAGRFEGLEKTEVTRQARAWWGHHNFRDEAEAFAAIFPPGA